MKVLVHPPRDVRGRELRSGDWVRLLAIPAPVAEFPQTHAVFQQALGQTFRIEAFDDYGHLELALWRKLKLPGCDTVWVEPGCCERSRRGRAW